MKNGWELIEISRTLIQYWLTVEPQFRCCALNSPVLMMVNFSLVYIQTMYNVFCLLLQIPLGRNNIMTLYSVKKGVLQTPLITGILEEQYFLVHFHLGIISLKKKAGMGWCRCCVENYYITPGDLSSQSELPNNF